MALSTMHGGVPSGDVVVGRFGGMVGERFPKLRVLIDRDGDDGPSTTERDIEVNGYRPQLVEAIQQLEKESADLGRGVRIAVAVWLDVRTFTYKSDDSRGGRWKAGDPGQMVTRAALSIHRLDG